MNESSKKSSGIRSLFLELKKKALMELAESGDTETVACHYNPSDPSDHYNPSDPLYTVDKIDYLNICY